MVRTLFDELDKPAEQAQRAVTPVGVHPRDYQREAVDAIFEEWKIFRSTIAILPTGAGKTVISMLTCKRVLDGEVGRGGYLFVTNRDSLVRQSYRQFRAAFPDSRVEVEQADRYASDRANIVVACIASIGQKARCERYAKDRFACINFDECFPAGTMIGSVPIEKIEAGDLVESFNHDTCLVERKRVVRTFASWSNFFVKITSGNRSITCTPNHPIFSADRHCYIEARYIKHGESILLTMSQENEKDSGKEMPLVRRNDDGDAMEDLRAKGVLLGTMPVGVLLQGKLTENGDNQQKARIVKDEKKQSDAQGWPAFENGGNPQEDQAQAKSSRRERDGYVEMRGSDGNSFVKGDRKNLGSDGSANRGEIKRREPESLQDRPSLPGANGCRGNRRKFSLREIETGAGQEKRILVKIARVDSVEIQEQGSAGKTGGMRSGCGVYNLEIEDNSNYFANGILVHNCHHAPRKNVLYDRVDTWFTTASVLGQTATPDRGDKVGLGSMFQSVAYSRDLLDIIDQGWLVPVRQVVEYCESVTLPEKKNSEDWSDEELEKALLEEGARGLWQIAAAAIKWANYGGKKRRCVIFTPGVESAKLVKDIINRSHAKGETGSAEVIHHKVDTRDREQIENAYRAGQIQYLVNNACLTEGFDDDGTTVIVIGRQTKKRGTYAQMAGRGTRVLGTIQKALSDATTKEHRKAIIRQSNKPGCLIVDMVASSHKLTFNCLDLLSGAKDAAVVVRGKKAIKPGVVVDPGTVLTKAEIEQREFERAEARKKIIPNVQFKTVFTDPFDTTKPGYHREQHGKSVDMATSAQTLRLVQFGIPAQEARRMTKKRASDVLGVCIERSKLGLCGYKAATFLISHGYSPDVTEAEFRRILYKIRKK